MEKEDSHAVELVVDPYLIGPGAAAGAYDGEVGCLGGRRRGGRPRGLRSDGSGLRVHVILLRVCDEGRRGAGRMALRGTFVSVPGSSATATPVTLA